MSDTVAIRTGGLETDPSRSRNGAVDCLRGGLLVAMLAVHLIAAHAAPAQAKLLHERFGIFLISAAFVALSGFLTGLPSQRRGFSHGALTALRLLLVMVGFAVLAALLRQGLGAALGTAEGCAPSGFRPPERFESLGILLPIALVALLSPLVRLPGFTGWMLGITLGVAWAVAPTALGWTRGEGGGWVAGILFRRAVTPYYTVSTFVALVLAGALLSRAFEALEVRGAQGALLRSASLATAVVLATPPVASVIDAVYRGSATLGELVAFLYWTAPSPCCSGPTGRPSPGLMGPSRARWRCLEGTRCGSSRCTSCCLSWISSSVRRPVRRRGLGRSSSCSC